MRKFALNSLRGTENLQLQCTAIESYVSVLNNEDFAELSKISTTEEFCSKCKSKHDAQGKMTVPQLEKHSMRVPVAHTFMSG